jgi:glucosylceramidase
MNKDKPDKNLKKEEAKMTMYKEKYLKVIVTAKDTDDRLQLKSSVKFEQDLDGCENGLINIYEDVIYQEIEGFGGAFTEAASVTLDKLGEKNREEVLNAYFNPEKGIGYSFCRTHINSCDFSLGNYTYVEKEGDVNLETFSIERDKKSLLRFIKDAMNVDGADFRLFASPWSPPAWMKTNFKMNEGGKLKEEYRESWAKYYARYIKEYSAEGVKIWGLTVQNEAKATQRWDSCVFTAEEERDFVKDYLGPVLDKAGMSDVKIMIWDHNKERVYERAKVAFSDPEAAKYIWGTAFHWYSGDHFESVDALHHMYPDKKLIFTEGCAESFKAERIKSGSWSAGEMYGHDIIGDLNNWTSAWVDWNLILDEQGGPNHVGNYCNASIIADTANDQLLYQSAFYYIGHFSKFIRPGARRIGCSRYTDKLEAAAFKNSDGSVAVVVMNRTEKDIAFKLRNEYGLAELKSLPHSIMTLIY